MSDQDFESTLCKRHAEVLKEYLSPGYLARPWVYDELKRLNYLIDEIRHFNHTGFLRRGE